MYGYWWLVCVGTQLDLDLMQEVVNNNALDTCGKGFEFKWSIGFHTLIELLQH